MIMDTDKPASKTPLKTVNGDKSKAVTPKPLVTGPTRMTTRSASKTPRNGVKEIEATTTPQPPVRANKNKLDLDSELALVAENKPSVQINSKSTVKKRNPTDASTKTLLTTPASRRGISRVMEFSICLIIAFQFAELKFANNAKFDPNCVSGIPLILSKKTTKPVPFNFASDQRAKLKKVTTDKPKQ